MVLRWLGDGQPWSASGLAEHILRETSGHNASITGPTWWADETGLRLHELLEEYIGEPVYAASLGERDWTGRHELLAQLQPGEWTTYKGLADAIGSSAIAVGRHVAHCPSCPHASRVLTSRGTVTVSGGFRWDDGERDDDSQALLEREGVRFDEVWSRVALHAGETFKQMRGGEFTYEVRSGAVWPDRTNRALPSARERKTPLV